MAAQRAYRPDIDGLRAVAVLCVVLYHLSSRILPGGFVGVDVFFVISGFLITQVIRDAADERRFSFLDFYSRRIRRIFPSLLLVFAFALITGWFVLFSLEYKRLASGVFFGSLFWSNFYLLRESGYFDQVKELKAFLHLWSLGVEEQFYIVWPILMVLFRGRVRCWLVAACALASFIFCVRLSQTSHDAAFYLPTSRFWELAAGCLLALFRGGESRERPLVQSVKSAVGLILILLSALIWNQDSVYPSFRALLPVLGAFLVIDAGARAKCNRVLLSQPIAVTIGLISYPLYLWHWTLLFFVRVLESGEPSFLMQIGAVLLSGLLAWFSYRFIEIPIRKAPRTVSYLILANAGLMGLSFFALNHGNPHHETDETLNPWFIKEENTAPCRTFTSRSQIAPSCTADSRENPTYALIGDSHAGAIFPSLVKTSHAGARWMYLSQLGCPLVLNPSGFKSCDALNQQLLQDVAADPKIRLVLFVIASRYISSDAVTLVDPNAVDRSRPGLDPSPEAAASAGIADTIRRLESAHKKVALLVDNPAITAHPDLCFPRFISLTGHLPSKCSISRDQYDAVAAKYLRVVQGAKAAFPELLFFDFTDIFCDSDRCSVMKNGQLLYSFSDHMSSFAAGIVGQRINDWLSTHQH